MVIEYKDCFNTFLDMEDKLGLFNQKIAGVYYWERIRFAVWREVLQARGIIGQAHTRLPPTITTRFNQIRKAIVNCFDKNPYLAPKGDLFFYGHPRRKLGPDGKWWDIYCDPILEDLDRPYVYFEDPYLGGHLVPAKTRNIRYFHFALAQAAIRRRLASFLKMNKVILSESETHLLVAIGVELMVRFNVSVDVVSRVDLMLRGRQAMLPVYIGILQRVNPKLAVVIVSYGKETFVEACRMLGIPVVELQHGVISRYHLGYAFPGSGKKRCFPDYLFLFGGFWKAGIDYPIDDAHIFSMGYPYFESERSRCLAYERRDQIVFISQGTIGARLSRFAVGLAKTSDFPFQIVYKLHPGEYDRWKKEYPWLLNANIRVVDSDDTPLYQLFAESKVQLGVASTALYEGLGFGLRTFVLDAPGAEYMDALIQQGHATKVDSVTAFKKELSNGCNCDTNLQTEFFFKGSAKRNIIDGFDRIIEYGSVY